MLVSAALGVGRSRLKSGAPGTASRNCVMSSAVLGGARAAAGRFRATRPRNCITQLRDVVRVHRNGALDIKDREINGCRVRRLAAAGVHAVAAATGAQDQG